MRGNGLDPLMRSRARDLSAQCCFEHAEETREHERSALRLRPVARSLQQDIRQNRQRLTRFDDVLDSSGGVEEPRPQMAN
jgi:hypothetical protein